jgi:hypothetical protein
LRSRNTLDLEIVGMGGGGGEGEGGGGGEGVVVCAFCCVMGLVVRIVDPADFGLSLCLLAFSAKRPPEKERVTWLACNPVSTKLFRTLWRALLFGTMNLSVLSEAFSALITIWSIVRRTDVMLWWHFNSHTYISIVDTLEDLFDDRI